MGARDAWEIVLSFFCYNTVNGATTFVSSSNAIFVSIPAFARFA